jgi:hypothetical protein
LLFSERSVQQHTLDKKYPPNPYNFENEDDWKKSFARIFKHCIDIHKDSVPLTDYNFWVVAFHDDKGDTIHRQDADKNEINRIKADKGDFLKVWRDFQTTHKPSKWVVWPHSESKGWCDKIEGLL